MVEQYRREYGFTRFVSFDDYNYGRMTKTSWDTTKKKEDCFSYSKMSTKWESSIS